jgi:hypothetical protein
MHIRSPLTALACAAATLLLAGCHATVDARWANSDDTVDHWKKAMPNLPVEVRGALPEATSQQIAQAISSAKTTEANPASERLVVELSQAEEPRDDTYCAQPGKRAATGGSQAPTAITLAICDGARLVATSGTSLDPAKTTVSTLAKRVDSLKKLALIGIARSQTDAYQIQG